MKKPLNPKTFCVLPWTHLEVKTDGQVSPCCFSTDMIPKTSTENFNLNKDDISEVFDSPYMQSLRNNLLNGVQDKNCVSCWHQEKLGEVSRRNRANLRFGHIAEKIEKETYQVTQPVSLDLKFGNLCNLKCRICSPLSSSSWVGEFAEIYGKDGIPLGVLNWQEHNEKFWKTLHQWLPKMEHLAFFGGEPFLIKRHYEILQMSVEKGYAKNQTLHYNSNGTIFPDEAVKKLFPHFKEVCVMLSFDGVREQFEYQRHPAKWDQVYKNWEKYKQHNIFSLICLTVSGLNLFYLPDYLEFWKERGEMVSLNTLTYPEKLDYRVYPAEIKKIVAEKLFSYDPKIFKQTATMSFEAQLHNMLSADLSHLWPEFIKTVETHDQYRGESFAKTFPEFFEICRPYWKL